ncbi:hypothetical protein AOA80_07025 [Methanomassiliicoccales archaeon RumEn M1]|nr:hypothetical protein AOA80_07025 [Methanomassiliicoccales archaeon RumEn M1]
MGLNLPIRRIIFMETEKFDGIERRELKPEEIKQIAGRAGRFGMYSKGFVGATQNLPAIRAGLEAVVPPLEYAVAGFSDLVLQVDFDLLEVLTQWNQMPTAEPIKSWTSPDISPSSPSCGRWALSCPRSRSSAPPTSPLTRPKRPCGSFFQLLRRWQQGEAVEQPGLSEEEATLPELELYYKSWTSISPSPRPSAVLWTRTSSTTAGSGWPTRSMKSCSTACAATSASAPGAAKPSPSTTGGGCATPVSERTAGRLSQATAITRMYDAL